VRIHQWSRTVIDHDGRWRLALKGSTAALALVGCGVAPPPVLPATAGLHRIVRFERHQQVDAHDRTGNPIPPYDGCWRIALDERVVKATADREFEIDALVVGGNHPSCGLGCRVTISADRQQGARVQVVKEGTDGCSGLPFMVQPLHARLGMRNGPFAVSHEFPWDHPLGKVRVGGVDYRAYGSEERQERDQPYRRSTHTHSSMHVRLEDRRLACFSFSMDTISENPEYGGSASSYSESLDIDYGDGALSPCP
jgi:hypothetical protein